MKPSLIEAAITGDNRFVREVLQKETDPETRDRHSETALVWAAHLGHTAVVKDMLAAGADREARGGLFQATPLVLAARGGHRGIVALLAVLANVNARDSRGATPLMVAVEQHAETLKPQRRITAIVRTLIDAGANPNLQDHQGNTALMWAVFWGNKEVVRMLLDAGANLNVKNDEGQTALAIADEIGDQEIVALLHKAGALE